MLVMVGKKPQGFLQLFNILAEIFKDMEVFSNLQAFSKPSCQ